MPNRAESVGAIRVDFDADASGVVQGARRAEQAVERAVRQMERLNNRSVARTAGASDDVAMEREYYRAIERVNTQLADQERILNGLRRTEQGRALAQQSSGIRENYDAQERALSKLVSAEEKRGQTLLKNLDRKERNIRRDRLARSGFDDSNRALREEIRAREERRVLFDRFATAVLRRTRERIDAEEKAQRLELEGNREIRDDIVKEERRARNLRNQQIRRQFAALDREGKLSGERVKLIRNAVKGEEALARQAERFEGSTRRSTGYLSRQLGALRDFVIRYATIVGGFTAIGGLGVGVGAAIRQGEELFIVQDRLRALIGTSDDFATSWVRIQEVADRTGTSLAGTADLFETVFLQLEELPGAGAAAADFVEGINLLFLGSASSAEESRRAIVQLQQILQKGFGSAQDVRILREQVRLFDDLFKAAGITSTRISAEQLISIVTTGPGRALIEDRAASAEGRISREAQLVANTFQELSSQALVQSGLINTINEGLRYFDDQLQSVEFQLWFNDFFVSLDDIAGRFFELSPIMVRLGQQFADFVLNIISLGDYFVRLAGVISEFFNIYRLFSLALLSIQITGVIADAISRNRANRISQMTDQELIDLATSKEIGKDSFGQALKGLSIDAFGTKGQILERILKGGGYVAGIIGLTLVLNELLESFTPEFPKFERSEGRRGRPLYTATGDIRYGEFSRYIEDRARVLGKEEFEVQRLLQIYRALDKEQRGQAITGERDINARLSLVQRLTAEIEKLEEGQKKLLAEGEVDFSNAVLPGLLALRGADDEAIIAALKRRGIDADSGIADQFRTFAEAYARLDDPLRKLIAARKLLQGHVDELKTFDDFVPLEELIRSRGAFSRIGDIKVEDYFNALSQYWSQAARGVDALANQIERSRIQEKVRDLAEKVRTEADASEFALKIAEDRFQLFRDNERTLARRGLREAELSKDDDLIRQAQLAVQISNRDFDVLFAQGDATNAVAKYSARLETLRQDRRDFIGALVTPEQESKLEAERVKGAIKTKEDLDREINKLLTPSQLDVITQAEGKGTIADAVRIGSAERNLETAKRLRDLIDEFVRVGGDIEALDARRFALLFDQALLELQNALSSRQRTIQGVNIYELFASRTAEARFDNQASLLSLYSELDVLDKERRVQLESQLFLTQQIRNAEIALRQAELTGNQSAVTSNEELLRQLRTLDPEVQKLIDRWIEFREQGIELDRWNQEITDGLERMGRVSEFVVSSLRDGFIELIDSARSFNDVLSGVLTQLRNLALDVLVFEPFERGFRDFLTKGFLRNVVKDVNAQTTPVSVNLGGRSKPALGDGGGTTEVYQTNYIPPNIAAHYQRDLAEFAVQQHQQFEANPNASGLG